MSSTKIFLVSTYSTTDEALRTRNDYVYLSHEFPTLNETHPEEGEDSIPCTPTEDKITTSKHIPELELNCKHCAMVIKEHIQLEESNKVYINRLSGEVLIFPKDETYNDSGFKNT